ncbi:MAG: T9SS type A sorting domain-containing protein [Bacteroidales bacterium]|nr:T9SS type A sorting domain-containing protein [Bacteroidales bacterium]
MKQSYFFKLSKTIFTAVISFAFFTIQAQPALTPNGGLEEASAGATSADPWYLGASSGNAEFTVIDSVAHSGSKCLFINVIQKYTGNFWDIQAVYEHIPVTPGMYYRATFYARSTSGFKLRAAIGTYNNYAELTNSTVTIGKDWTRVALVCYNADQEELRVTISAFETGQYYIDDMSLIESPIAGAVVVPTGDSIIIQTISSIDPSSNFDPASFTVTADGTPVPVQKVVIVPKQNNKLALILNKTILPNQKVELSHTGGKIFYSNTNNLPDDNLIAFGDDVFNLSQATGNGVGNAVITKATIYPNPAGRFVHVKAARPISSISIYTITGQLVNRIQNPSSTIEIGYLNSGSYLIVIEDSNGNQYRAKLLKK